MENCDIAFGGDLSMENIKVRFDFVTGFSLYTTMMCVIMRCCPVGCADHGQAETKTKTEAEFFVSVFHVYLSNVM